MKFPTLQVVDGRHPTWDTSLFRFLSLRVKGDDRRYYINVQTDSFDPIELWQHRLFLRTPGQWETVLIPWSDFLRTRNGRISYKKFDGMDRERVKTVGASLIERKEGPYCLHVAEIKVLHYFSESLS
jgi:NADH dehydrogenase [ubiquinone] 1 alpha subcomplex assembly factor 1